MQQFFDFCHGHANTNLVAVQIQLVTGQIERCVNERCLGSDEGDRQGQEPHARVLPDQRGEAEPK
jgi:hypothetical protein